MANDGLLLRCRTRRNQSRKWIAGEVDQGKDQARRREEHGNRVGESLGQKDNHAPWSLMQAQQKPGGDCPRVVRVSWKKRTQRGTGRGLPDTAPSPIRTLPSAPEFHRIVLVDSPLARGLYRRSGLGRHNARPHPNPEGCAFQNVALGLIGVKSALLVEALPDSHRKSLTGPNGRWQTS